MADNIRLVTFTGETVTPQDDAILYQSATVDGVYQSLAINISSPTTLHLTGSFAIMGGRFIEIPTQDITVPLAPSASGLVGQVYILLDMANTDNPIQLITETADTLSDLTTMSTPSDVNVSLQQYSMQLCVFGISTTTIYDLTESSSTSIPVTANILPLSANDIKGASINSSNINSSTIDNSTIKNATIASSSVSGSINTNSLTATGTSKIDNIIGATSATSPSMTWGAGSSSSGTDYPRISLRGTGNSGARGLGIVYQESSGSNSIIGTLMTAGGTFLPDFYNKSDAEAMVVNKLASSPQITNATISSATINDPILRTGIGTNNSADSYPRAEIRSSGVASSGYKALSVVYQSSSTASAVFHSLVDSQGNFLPEFYTKTSIDGLLGATFITLNAGAKATVTFTSDIVLVGHKRGTSYGLDMSTYWDSTWTTIASGGATGVSITKTANSRSITITNGTTSARAVMVLAKGCKVS